MGANSSQVLLLDSDILSEILKGKDSHVHRNMLNYITGVRRLSFASVSVLEILYGYERVGGYAQIKRAVALFDSNEEVLLEKEDYRLAATIAGAMSKQGTFAGLVDPLIAACAIRCGYGIGTGNTAHFESIRRAGFTFPLENWRNI